MQLSYKKLWKMLIDRDMSKADFRDTAGVSSASIAKLTSGSNITADVLLKLCTALDCNIEDIIETIKD